MSSSNSVSSAANVPLDALSVYIPYVYTNVSKQTIADAFQKADVGTVGKIDFVVKKDTKMNRDYHNCYVHFTEWSSCDYAKEVRAAIESGEPIKLFYTLPAKGRGSEKQFFWSLLKNTYVKKAEQPPAVQAAYSPRTPPCSPPTTPSAPSRSARKAPVLARSNSIQNQASEFEEIATDADAPGFVPFPNIDLVSTDYVERMEQQCGQYRMQLFQQEAQIQALSEQLRYYMQKSSVLENNLVMIEQQMCREMAPVSVAIIQEDGEDKADTV